MPIKLTFKKKGKIVLEMDNKKERFSMNFKEKKGEKILFGSSADTFKICSNKFPELGELYGFSAVVQSTFQFSKYTSLSGEVNDEWLILFSSSKIIDEPYYEFDFNRYTQLTFLKKLIEYK